ncbi:hybrid sensor histidine kinase/response regulator transcription factor [Niabella beijingensis]|uniref:hybrid sensor histidine kinase/response regulator transcription factor n=1 Tax=Niabella beijingensis TaxID=2872700 RepID=UPI0021D4651B|nr:hybrid sensor histidine kinase/response regulator transcription factor [Niabella beijingensis]
MLVTLLLFCEVAAQPPARYFGNISVDKGLSQSTVFAVVQDSLGFMWMGTQDGLNRYDGKSFRIYRPVKNLPGSIGSYYIKCLFTDREGRLWIGGNGGISSYNYEGDSFNNYNITPHPGEWYISAVIQDPQGILWACSNSGELYRSDKAGTSFRAVDFDRETYGIKELYSITPVGKKMLLGTGNGLWLLDLDTKKTEPFNAGVGNVRINTVYADGSDLWIGTEGAGLIRMDTKGKPPVNYRRGTSGIPDDDVRSICRDATGNIWIGTFRGLAILDAQGRMHNYYHQADLPFTLSQNSVRCIYRDKQAGMWLGTFYGGVNYYHSQQIRFNQLSQNSGTPALNDKVVNVIRQDHKGGFWIGTNDRGLNYWQPGTNSIRYYTHNENGQGLSSNNIKAIAFGDNGTVFLGMHNTGLDLLDPATGTGKNFRHDPGNPRSIPGDMVYALLKDHSGRIWVGTRSGFSQFQYKEAAFTPLFTDRTGSRLSSDEITFLMEDSRHRIWIGTTRGVNLFYPDNMLFEPLARASLSSDVINFIAEDPEKRIWIGTRDGLNLYDETAKSFINYNQRKDFLRGNINSMLPDDEGNLWIAANTSLVKYHPGTGKLQYFDSRDGLQNGQFNTYASCRAADGMLLFGGINGISYFYPRALKQDALPLRVTFTGLEVFDHTVVPGDATGILKSHINQADLLRFGHEYKQFAVSFNTFNYVSANRTKYFYRLDGFDNGWQETEGVPRVSYTNLQPGNYTLHLKAVGPQGEVSPERLLRIRILPVWYRSTWFYLVVILLIAAAAYFLYRIFTERMRTMHQLKLERLEREKVNDINQVKTEFFTNVSHELRTPLTLILAPLEEMTREPVADKKIRRRHELMLMNTRRLYQLVNQLFEFRKTEMGTRRLRVSRSDLVRFAKEVYRSFNALAEKNETDYRFSAPVEGLVFYFDRDALENILFNLLSNAFKYTPLQGHITLGLSQEAGQAVIQVTDSGTGIERRHLEHIFDRFYQVDRQETNLGSGVGLAFTKRLVELHHGTIEVNSVPGQGSVFTVRLPMDDPAYEGDVKVEGAAAEQISDDPAGEVEEPVTLTGDKESDGMETAASLLVVDDNEEMVQYIKEYFSTKYTVETAGNGEEALELLRTYQPDLIISDIMMPEMDGLHFCRRIKQNIQTSHLPVLLLTAKSETRQQIKGFEMGADAYVTKPFSIALLDARVQSLLRSRRQLKEYYSASKTVEPDKITFNTIDEEFLRQVISVVEENIDAYDFSVDKLSREVGMSRTNLYLKLKAITGESATALIRRIRLGKAAGLIESGKHTIGEIAYLCGFNTASYFSTAFRQFYGCMPSEYLERKRDPDGSDPL